MDENILEAGETFTPAPNGVILKHVTNKKKKLEDRSASG